MDEVGSVLLGLECSDVLDAVETADGLLEVTVETIDPVLGCPECGAPAGRSRGRPVVGLRDMSSAGRRVRVWWRKHCNECPDVDCDRRSFTEQHDDVVHRVAAANHRTVSGVDRQSGWPGRSRRVAGVRR